MFDPTPSTREAFRLPGVDRLRRLPGMRCLVEDLATFAVTAGAWLRREPVLHNVLLTLVADRLSGDVPLSGDERFVRVVDGGETVGAMVWTPPRGPLLAAMPVGAARTLAEHLVRAAPLVEVHGPVPAAGGFAERYAECAHLVAVPGTAQRIFALDAVRLPTGVPGHARPATTADRDLLVSWAVAFAAETSPGRRPVDLSGQVDARLRHGLLWLWEWAGRPVSTAWLSRPVAEVVRVSGVFTPPGERGRGFASGCVAHVSRHALDAGATTCTLYTDLANPTSNRIYQALGYRRVAEAAQWRFAPPSEVLIKRFASETDPGLTQTS
ncbi:GNAT family N-acetyltransferase [Micromonospora sp. C81]|uniref:GNAT family N-acetyltransferase n=1 Tax=Micromonospora sp. C81 TaxID=2824881 RepID=UPI001B36ED5F|nr:GNAT family N-acetyltransferase [Micromonospora sp. C81]MBQ1040076.1 GNAT family N-acetyltransferase [Micromonospora sp. C81]